MDDLVGDLDATVGAAAQRVRAECSRGASRSRLRVAEGMLEQGDELRDLRRFEDALECYERLGAELRDVVDPRARELESLALTAVAGVRVQQGQAQDALALSDVVLDQVRGKSTVAFLQCEAFACAHRSAALVALGRAVEAEEVADRLVRTFERDPVHGPKRVNVVAVGLQRKAGALVAQQRFAEADAVASELISGYGGDSEDSVALVVAQAKATRALALASAGELERAGQIRAELADEFDDAPDARFREVAIRATTRQAFDLISADRPEEALELAETLVGELNERPLSDRPDSDIGARLMKARALRVLGRTETATETLRDVLRRADFSASRRPTRKRLAGEAMLAAAKLAQTGRHEVALGLLDELLIVLEKVTPSPDIVAPLLGSRLLLVRDTSAPEVLVVACDDVIARLANRTHDSARRATSTARREKAVALGVLGQSNAAKAACDELIEAHRSDGDAQIREAVAAGLAYKATLQQQRGRRRAALRTLKELEAHCGNEPTPELERWAQEARRHTAVLQNGLSDRQRVQFASALPAIIAVTAIALQFIRRWLRTHPRSH